MSDREWIERALAEWRAAGIIDDAQAAAIRARPVTPAAESSSGASLREAGYLDRSKDKLVAVISTIGAIVVGLGVILLVATNWEEIAASQRLILLTTGTAAFYGLGWKLRASGNHPSIATSVLLIGTLVFGASIFLIGQTYHVEAHDPLAFLVLAVAATGMALVLDSRPHGGVAAAALGAWWVYEIADLMESADGDPFLALTTAAALGGAALLGAGQTMNALVAADRIPQVRPLGGPFKVTGYVILSGAMTVLSLAHRFGDVSSPSDGGYVLLSAAVAAVTCMALYLVGRHVHSSTEALVMGALVIALTVSALGASAYLISVVANIALVVLALGGIALGVARRDKAIYGLGVAIAMIDIAIRYFDFLFNTLSGGLFFIGAGGVLIGIGWLISRTRQAWKEQVA